MTKIPGFLRRWGRNYLLHKLPEYGYELVYVRGRNPLLVGNVFDEHLILCNFCGTIFKRTGPDHSEGLICPNCDAIARERVIYQCILNEIGLKSKKALSFFRYAPELKQYKLLECSPRYHPVRRQIYNETLKKYLASDFDMMAHRTDLKLDLTAEEDVGPFQDYFDIIVCSHVLEHIPDYRKALHNLHRMLSPNGFLVLQVPIPESKYVKVTWDEFHQDNTRVYHRFGFDLLSDLRLIFQDAKAVVGLLDFEVTSPEIKPDKFESIKKTPDQCIILGGQLLTSYGLGSPDLCDAFIAYK